MSAVSEITKEMHQLSSPSRAAASRWFFKTGPGQYGEGDRFLGLTVPQTRAVTKQYQKTLTLQDLDTLLNSKWHEVRLGAVIAMRAQFEKADEQKRTELYNLYLSHIGKGINNWDIVDISCPNIIGKFLLDKNRAPLYSLAEKELWHKRVSIISTFYFLKYDAPIDTYQLAEKLVYEKHDLLQKAVGWSLREMGKKDGQLLRQFLDKYAATMPRTALRYSIEKFSDAEKKHYMRIAK